MELCFNLFFDPQRLILSPTTLEFRWASIRFSIPKWLILSPTILNSTFIWQNLILHNFHFGPSKIEKNFNLVLMFSNITFKSLIKFLGIYVLSKKKKKSLLPIWNFFKPKPNCHLQFNSALNRRFLVHPFFSCLL